MDYLDPSFLIFVFGFSIVILGILYWLKSVPKRHLKHNIENGFSVEKMTVEEVTKAWVVSKIKAGIGKDLALLICAFFGFVIMVYLFSLEPFETFGAMGLVLGPLIALTPRLIFARNAGHLYLDALPTDLYVQVFNFFAENRANLVIEARNLPDVRRAEESRPKWLQNLNLWFFDSEYFRPLLMLT